MKRQRFRWVALCAIALGAVLASMTSLEAAVWTGTGVNPTEFTADDNWDTGFPVAGNAYLGNDTNPTAILSNIAPPGSLARFDVGNGGLGLFHMSDQTLTVTTANLFVGRAGNGAIYQTGGVLEFGAATHAYGRMGYSAGEYGYYSLSGTGVLQTGSGMRSSWIVGNSGIGAMEQAGGAINLTSNFFVAQKVGSKGVFNQTGGTLTVGHSAIGNGDSASATDAYGMANIKGTFSVNGTIPAGTAGAQALIIGNVGEGSVNLQQTGVIEAPWIKKGTGKGQLNFHGGTLRATLDDAPGYTWIDAAGPELYVYQEGATIDTAGHSVTAAVPLSAPTTGVGISHMVPSMFGGGGSGYYGAPVVVITGGSGSGAAALANVDLDPSSGTYGQVTGFTVVNPGTGYVSGETLLVTLYGGTNGMAVQGADVTFNAGNASGGLTKKGAGTLTLAATNTYTGATTVEEGALSVTGSVAGNVILDGDATLMGTGTIGGNVVCASGSNVEAGASVGILTLNGNVDLSVGASLTWELGSLQDGATGTAGTDFDQLSILGALTLGGASQVALDFSLLAETDRPGSATPNAFWAANHSWKIVDVGDAGSTAGDFATVVNGTFGTGSFDTSVVGGDVFLNYVASSLPPVPGDTDNNRIVDATDAAKLAENWGRTDLGGGGYGVGDFNGDGAVNAADASILAANWGNHAGEAATAAPEPSMLAVLLAGLFCFAAARKPR